MEDSDVVLQDRSATHKMTDTILAQFPQESALATHYIYARVSTDKQSPEAQLLEVLRFCQRHNLPVMQKNIVYEEDVSGKIPWKDRAIGRMAATIPEGSTIIVPEFSRVGRSMADVQKLMGLLTERHITLLDAKTGEWFDGGRDSMLKTTFLAYFADLEHEMISARTTAGVAAARARWVHIGRPHKSKLDAHGDRIRELLAAGASVRTIAGEIGAQIGTLHDWIKAHKGGVCTGREKKLCGKAECRKCHYRSFASHEKAAYAVGWSPHEHSLNSHTKLPFTCPTCPHTYEASPHSINNGRGCPYCSSPPKRLCDDPACQRCFQRSFAFHTAAAEADGWDARTTFLNSNSALPFICSVCAHQYTTTPAGRASGRGCPYCAGQARCACDACQTRTFASHPKASCATGWDPSGQPRTSNRALPFTCDACGHSFESTLGNVSKGQWCPYCSIPPKRLCAAPDCQTCHGRSFANHPKAACARDWDPRQHFRGSHCAKAFCCDACGYLFEARLYSVRAGGWCPACKHKTQRDINAFLQASPYSITHDRGDVPNPLGGKPYQTDWILQTPRGTVAIELDGGQHFREVAHWGGAEALAVTRARDIYKMLHWLHRGARFIRLHQEDVRAERFDWKTALRHAIEEDTRRVVCLEADPEKDSWAELRAEVTPWIGRDPAEWVAEHGHRLSGLGGPSPSNAPTDAEADGELDPA